MEHPVVLFDGVCNLCNASVNFIMANDTKNIFRFAALQSKAGKALLKKFNLSSDALDAVVLIENKKVYTKSAAALRIAQKLKKPLPLFFSLSLVPPFIRDAVYTAIAKNRYRWFGKSKSCRVPSAGTNDRFLD